MTSTTLASRQAMAAARDGADPGGGSGVAAITLLTPRVTIVVVAERLPKSPLVVFHETQLTHPLGALPEVEVGQQQARGPAVLGRERRTAEFHGHPRLATRHV